MAGLVKCQLLDPLKTTIKKGQIYHRFEQFGFLFHQGEHNERCQGNPNGSNTVPVYEPWSFMMFIMWPMERSIHRGDHSSTPQPWNHHVNYFYNSLVYLSLVLPSPKISAGTKRWIERTEVDKG